MEDSPITKIVERPDGSQVLLFRQARIAVVKGPNKGKAVVIDRPRVLVGSGTECDLQLDDTSVSRQHLEIKATDQGYRVRDLDSTNGTFWAGARVGELTFSTSATLRIGESVLELSPTTDTVEVPISSRLGFGRLLGQSIEMRQIFAILERVAPSAATILLEGESGTGKDVVAQSIHEISPRADGPFVVVDCGAIPESLIASELFGHEKGAFTGADQSRVGTLKEAEGGTVLLDEVGELPLKLQPHLLRFLETQEVKPVGAAQHRKVDVRIIAATNRPLLADVREGRFRQDLYYRLSVVRIELPPLRDRPDDIRLLATRFAEGLSEDPRSIITDQVLALLVTYHWPGNARELRNMVERLALMPELALKTLKDGSSSEQIEPSIGPLLNLPFHEARRRWQDAFERQYLNGQMQRAAGVVSRAAADSDLPRQSLHRLLRRHQI